jgi:hypothetical protein
MKPATDIIEELRQQAKNRTSHLGVHDAWQQTAEFRAIEKIQVLQAQAAPMRPIKEAKKDGTRILILLKSPIPNSRDDLRRWYGVPFVARHRGLAEDGFDIGWSFAAPVGCGGFPDDWIAGWWPLPEGANAAEDDQDISQNADAPT